MTGNGPLAIRLRQLLADHAVSPLRVCVDAEPSRVELDLSVPRQIDALMRRAAYPLGLEVVEAPSLEPLPRSDESDGDGVLH